MVREEYAEPVVCQISSRMDDGSAACEPWTAMFLALALWSALRAALRTRADLALENLALRQQLALLRRRSKRPRFGRLDRAFWLWLSNRWSGWRQALHLVRPRPSFAGTGRASGLSGLGSPVAGEWVDHGSARRLRNSCAPWRSRNPLWGAPRNPRRIAQARF